MITVNVSEERAQKAFREVWKKLVEIEVEDEELFIAILGYGAMLAKEHGMKVEGFLKIVEEVWESVVAEEVER